MEHANISQLEQMIIEEEMKNNKLKELKKIKDENKELIKSIHETNASIEIKDDTTVGPTTSSAPPTQSTIVTPEIRIQSSPADTNTHRNDLTRISNIPRNEKLYYDDGYYIMVDDNGNVKVYHEKPGQEDKEIHITTQQYTYSIPRINGKNIQVTENQICRALEKEGVIRIQANKVNSQCKPNYEFIKQPNNKDIYCINNNRNYLAWNDSSYQTVTINGKTTNLHRLISEIYIKYKNINIRTLLNINPKKYVVDHINNNRSNNNVNNLRIVTHSQNMANKRPTHRL